MIVLTHDAKIDDPALEWALRAGAGYVGALGSRRTQGLRQERLVEMGVAREDVERIYGPIGLDIGGHTPAETAIAIVAEVIAHRSGRSRPPAGGDDGPHPPHDRAGVADRATAPEPCIGKNVAFRHGP